MILRFLSRALILSLAVPILGRYVGGKLVVPALVASALLAVAGSVQSVLSIRREVSRIPIWVLLFVLFLAVGIVSTFV